MSMPDCTICRASFAGLQTISLQTDTKKASQKICCIPGRRHCYAAAKPNPFLMPFRTSTTDAPAKKMAALSRPLFPVLLGAAYLLVLIRLWWPIHLPGRPNWPGAVLLVLAVIGTIAALARQLPLQNVLFATVIIGLVGGGVTWLNLKTQVPFGPVGFGDAGPKIFKQLPWGVPAVWIVAILNSRGVGRLVLRPWRKTKNYGIRLIGLTVALTVLFDFALEPFATRVKHYWFWEPTKFPLTWQGAPVVGFLSWAVITLLILAFVTPILINKHPHQKSRPDFHPLFVWLGAVLLFAVGAAVQGIWAPVAADTVIGGVTAVFAVRGARW